MQLIIYCNFDWPPW